MKTLAKSLAIFLLVIFSTGSPILAINLVTSEFTVNLELKLLFLIDWVFSLVKKEAKNNVNSTSYEISSLRPSVVNC